MGCRCAGAPDGCRIAAHGHGLGLAALAAGLASGGGLVAAVPAGAVGCHAFKTAVQNASILGLGVDMGADEFRKR